MQQRTCFLFDMFPLTRTSCAALAVGLALAIGLIWSAPTTRAQDQSEPGAAATESEPAPVEQHVIMRVLANGIEVRKQSIPGINYVTVLVEFKTGDMNDPRDAPGLNDLLTDLAMTAPISGAEDSAQSPVALNREYPAGWNAHSYHDHAVLGWVIKTERLDDQLDEAAARLTKLDITQDAVNLALKRMNDDIEQRFTKEVQLIPMSWVVAKAFRHVSDPFFGISPERIQKLSLARLNREWNARAHPRNLRLYVCGNLGESEEALDQRINETFGQITPASDVGEPNFEVTVEAKAGGDRRRRVIVGILPSNKEQVVFAYYAPPIDDPDHPAFLTVCNELMKDARRLPGAQSRLPFQYSMLLDPRAAYVTPHIWRFPKGAGQALGYWITKINNKRFTNDDGRQTLRQLSWQLGEPIPGAVVAQIDNEPAVLYTFAYATAMRERYGDERFWEDYRAKLQRMRRDDLTAARDKYLCDDNIAIFVLSPKEH